MVAAFVAVMILAIFIPLDPDMPSFGLEPSWRMSMDQAIAQNLRIGKDLIFTFGPYSSIYTRTYHPATDHLMVWGSAFLAVCYALALLMPARGKATWALIGIVLFSAGIIQLNDARFVSYPLLLAACAHRLWGSTARHERSGWRSDAALGLLSAPFGLLPLVKGSLLVSCGATALLISCYAMLHRRFLAACLVASIPIASTALLWLISGQSLPDLPNYFSSMMPIISGYTEAMALTGPVAEVLAYLAAASLIMWALTSAGALTRSAKWFLGLCFGLALFTAFKGGLVRHDGHAVMAGNTLIYAGLILALIRLDRRVALALIASAGAWYFIDRNYVEVSPEFAAKQIGARLARAWNGVELRVTGNAELQRRYDQSLADIRKQYAVPPLPGNSDLYSYDQTFLFASKNIWNPRPVMQSYSAYTPELALLNERHLRTAGAPDNVVFRLQPIDDRLPMLEDGASWPALLDNYRASGFDGAMVYLRKKPMLQARSAFLPLGETTLKAGAEFALPAHRSPLFAQVDLQPTLLGKIASTVYKPPQLTMSLKLRDGTVKKYRVVSNMMQSGFFISPLVQDTRDFLLFARGNPAHLSKAKVASLSIAPDFGGGLLWNDSYTIKLQTYPPRPAEALPAALFDPMSDIAPEGFASDSPVNCEGTIDAIDGSPPTAQRKISALLKVDGWLTVSGKDGVVPDQVFVTLKREDGSGPVRFAQTRPVRRDDLRQHFKQPALPDAGFSSAIDVSKLAGDYVLGLARKYQGRIEHCAQPVAAIKIDAAD